MASIEDRRCPHGLQYDDYCEGCEQEAVQEDCNHEEYNFTKHGRCCHDCGKFMFDFGD